MILQEQECVLLCVEGGVNEDEAMLEVPPLLPAVRPSWPLIPWPFHAPHLDSWILLPPGGDFSMVPLPLEVSYKPWFITNL